MFRLVLSICVLGLAACAGTPVAPSAVLPDAPLPWQDKAFDYRPDLVTVSREDLFRLDPQLLQKIRQAQVEQLATPQRLKQLLALIFGPDLRRFAYAAGHSTIASETWRRQRGDCLSLAMLTYAVARAMDMDAQMQEVQAPVQFERRGRIDVVNQHVNVLFRRAHRKPLEDSEARDVVVDFEPELASAAKGRTLSENAILARYYNNLATEYLSSGRKALAYAHYKAAIQADPDYAASYGNLAILYRNAGMAREAEQMLRHAIALGDPADVALRALYQLLLEQGRNAEARSYDRLLQSRRERDPYYWIELGLQHLQAGENRQAIGALEHAKSMATGFEEVHRYLALAYGRVGESARAKEELAALASLARSEGAVPGLPLKAGKEEP